MRNSTSLTIIAASFALLSGELQAGSIQDPVRYRGNYTLGHEVNIFCPDINSQCYWLSGETPTNVRAALRQLSDIGASEPYQPVCVVIEGLIDRDTPREGFAADYDGLITVTRLVNTCAESTLVIESDLQHHRWVLESINGEPLPQGETDGMIPELDFGEKMHIAGNTGCNRYSGKGILRNEFFRIESMASTGRLCRPPQNELEITVQTVLVQESTILLDADKNLTLESGSAVLRFRLQDWVK